MKRAKRPNGSRCAWCQRVACRVGRPLCAKARAPFLCRCHGVNWGTRENVKPEHARPPHRRGSSCGRFGCCEHHPLASEKVYAIMSEPVRRVRNR